MATALLRFEYRQGQDTLHWFALLTHRRLFLDSAAKILEKVDHESLAAILEFVETMSVLWVLIGVSKDGPERGRLLRAFSYIGFQVVRPDQRRWLPTCTTDVFLVYTLDAPQIAKASNNYKL
ncbi:ornithine decarboxylase antizyme 3 [Dendropsophus ebraccatus]|uniref:ornithine decarboxylase antizyme 3 n=1 Tax=Dendropsophus ebraccatus TaxID=150705 RepID=UPI00383159E9